MSYILYYAATSQHQLDAVYCYTTEYNDLSVRLSVMTMSPAKIAKLIEIPFGTWSLVGPRNYVLDGTQIPQGKEHFWGGMTSGFFPHAAQNRFQWALCWDLFACCQPASTLADYRSTQVSHHIFPMKNSLCNAATRQNSLTTCPRYRELDINITAYTVPAFSVQCSKN